MPEQVEQIEYGDAKVRVIRQGCAEPYLALQPPQAIPYMVAPHAMEPQQIVDFFAAHVVQLEDLQQKMRKRFEKSSSEKCGYATGDIAYVMGRPFMLHVVPLRGGGTKMKSGARGRAKVKYGVDTDVSLITLHVMKLGDYDQARLAFLSYGDAVVLVNAPRMAKSVLARIAPGAGVPQVRMRDMRGGFARLEAGCLWLSHDIVPYPVDCLAYAVWSALVGLATVDEEELQAHLAAYLPGWQRAQEILQARAKPYSNQ